MINNRINLAKHLAYELYRLALSAEDPGVAIGALITALDNIFGAFPSHQVWTQSILKSTFFTEDEFKKWALQDKKKLKKRKTK